MLKEEKQFEKEYGKYWVDEINWDNISCSQKLSEKFIEKHADKVNWDCISYSQKLSEKFIEKHADKVNWDDISKSQKLSEKFIKKHTDKVNWYSISSYQKLSEKFIEKHKDKLDWHCISCYQKFSEKFIEKHKDKLDWHCISCYQKFSEEFIEKHSDKVNKKIQLRKHHRKYDPMKECKNYAKKHHLTIKNGFLHAFREHDQYGRGDFNKTIFYTKKNVKYKDWHCDLDPNEKNSFGLGIWPEGNTPVKVKLEDFGCEVKNDSNGKARVWAFQLA